MTRFRRAAHEIDAIRFDGSTGSAIAISAAFGGSVGVHGDRIEVRTGFGHVFAGAGAWVARDTNTRTLSVVDDRDIAAFDPLDG